LDGRFGRLFAGSSPEEVCIMTLRERVNEDVKAAMRAKESERLSALRLLLAAIKQREVDERIQLTDDDIVAVIEKMLKQRRESITQFEAGGRQDLADKEKFEVQVLSVYMPQPLSQPEIEQAIADAIAAAGAKSAQDMAKVITTLRSKLTGRADMAKVSALVKSRLTG
jgi:uncharacterized protein YqeY